MPIIVNYADINYRTHYDVYFKYVYFNKSIKYLKNNTTNIQKILNNYKNKNEVISVDYLKNIFKFVAIEK